MPYAQWVLGGQLIEESTPQVLLRHFLLRHLRQVVVVAVFSGGGRLGVTGVLAVITIAIVTSAPLLLRLLRCRGRSHGVGGHHTSGHRRLGKRRPARHRRRRRYKRFVVRRRLDVLLALGGHHSFPQLGPAFVPSGKAVLRSSCNATAQHCHAALEVTTTDVETPTQRERRFSAHFQKHIPKRAVVSLSTDPLQVLVRRLQQLRDQLADAPTLGGVD
jgi:hypothetical protein